MAYAIKAEIADPKARTLTFTAYKTMYGGKRIAAGDTVFVFASETQGGQASSRAASSLTPKRLLRSAASHATRRA